MKTYIGEEGLGKTWQEDFPANVECHKCKGNCRIMFVAFEDEPTTEKNKNVCDIHDNGEEEKFWPHDCIACAVYLCEKCFEPNAIMNQA